MNSEQEDAFAAAAQGLTPGPDLEWYAVDEHDHVALLTSGGFGPVPRLVFSSRRDFEALEDYLARLPSREGYTLHIAGPRDWSTWVRASRRGLFGYDWRSPTAKTYTRMTTPTTPLMASEVPAHLYRYLGAIQFPVSFLHTTELTLSDTFR